MYKDPDFASDPTLLTLQVKGNDNAVDLVRLVKPAALIPLMNAEIEGTGVRIARYRGPAPHSLVLVRYGLGTAIHDGRTQALSMKCSI
jgi:hypothetical protein